MYQRKDVISGDQIRFTRSIKVYGGMVDRIDEALYCVTR